jgi:hypothetical protein
VPPPVAIGGVGGSGTRLVAKIAASLGIDIGHDLNPAHDNLWYTLLFKHPEVPSLAPPAFAARATILTVAMTGERPLDDWERALVRALAAQPRPQHTREWLQERAESLLHATYAPRTPPRRWAWKEPNTHIALPQWRALRPDLRYVHVVRNGLDMAFSRNQNQRDLWGEALLGRVPEKTPRDSLAYWCAAHRRIADLGRTMGPDFLWLDYDRLCARPEAVLAQLAEFLRVPTADALALRDLVEPPSSSGRGRGHDLDQFDPDDLRYLRAIGHLV